MDVFISVDIEGITGLVSWSQCSRPDGLSYDYQFARRMMSHDVNAAIRGARAAGAGRIVVKDSHGNSKNLLIEDLEPGIELISGHGGSLPGGGTDGMMQGVDGTFDAAILVGYHAMAGTPRGVMEHTITGSIHRITINGIPVGEMGLAAGVAGRYGVPLVAVTSDEAGCAEIAALLPGVRTAAVKEGLSRYQARMLHPSVTGPMIEATVRAALTGPAALPAATEPGLVRADELARGVFAPEGPLTVRVEFNRSEEADKCGRLPLVRRVDGYAVEGTFPDFKSAHDAIWLLVDLSFQGIASQH